MATIVAAVLAEITGALAECPILPVGLSSLSQIIQEGTRGISRNALAGFRKCLPRL